MLPSRLRSSRLASLAGSLLLAGLLIQPAAAEAGGEPGDPGVFRRGGKHAAFLAGYGVGFRMGSDEDREKSAELRDVGIVNLIPRLGIGVTDPMGGDSWYRGNIEALFEGALLINTRPHSGVGGGLGTSLRYNFLFAERRFVPYLDANLGIVGIDFDLDRQADGFNFNVGAGGGVHWFVRPRTSIDTEVRWQHISNAGTRRPNDGINDVLFLLGVTHFFD